MWDDDAAPWDTAEEAPAAEEAAPAEAAPAAPAAAAPGAKGKDGKEEKPHYDWRALKLPMASLPHYTYHWVRPQYLNYRYIYDYRQNYYNDVIDWMNKRNRGIYRDTPRAQEWAERVMRTYDDMNVDKSHKRSSDMGILMAYKPKVRHYSYHTRAYYSLTYQKVL